MLLEPISPYAPRLKQLRETEIVSTHWSPSGWFCTTWRLCVLYIWGEIIIPMYKLWLHGLYEQQRARYSLSEKKTSNLIIHSLTHWSRKRRPSIRSSNGLVIGEFNPVSSRPTKYNTRPRADKKYYTTCLANKSLCVLALFVEFKFLWYICAPFHSQRLSDFVQHALWGNRAPNQKWSNSQHGDSDMTTSSNGNVFHITGRLWWESTGHTHFSIIPELPGNALMPLNYKESNKQFGQ